LMTLLPGVALLTALMPTTRPPTFGGPAFWLLAGAVSYGVTAVILLFITFAKLPLTAITVTGGLSGVILTSAILTRKQRIQIPNKLSRSVGWLILILLIAAVFRLVNIYYSDLQGDEADILLRAVRLTYGQTDAILTHSKGPGEILLLDAIGLLTGRFNEQTARLPFALAGVMSVGIITLLGEKLINPAAGRLAGLLAAIDGVFISYARTAQYQSVVLLLTLTAIYSFYQYRQTTGAARRWHGLGAFLLAAAFLFHFETILLVPVVVYLTVAHFAPPQLKQISTYVSLFKQLWPSMLIFTVVTGVFYVPFVLHPNVGETGSYLENRISAGDLPPFNNLGHFFYYEALKYNSVYYALLFNLLLITAAASATSTALNRPKPHAAIYWAGVALGGSALTIAGLPKIAAIIIALGMGLFLAAVILLPATPTPRRVLWLWIGPPFWVYVFLVNRPGKHHYLFLAALAILVAAATVKLWQRLSARKPAMRHPGGQWLTAGLGVIIMSLFMGHSVMLFLQSSREYILTFPAHQSALYPTDTAYPYGSRIGFGYPFRLGWQTIGQLKRTGQLTGSWAGNDAGNAPNWYMLGQEPSPCYPHYVIRGEITYKGKNDFDVPFNPADFGYIPRYQIWREDKLRMTLLEFNPFGADLSPANLIETTYFDPPITATDFAPALSAPPDAAPNIALNPALVLGEGSEIKLNAPPEYLERAQTLNGRVALIGYDLDEQFAQPAGIIPITLHWQTQNLLSLRYKVFIHLISAAGQQLAQADNFPACGTSHANSWAIGHITPDKHLLKLPADIAPGNYTLIVGMYEPELNLRLNYFDVAGNEQGNSLTVGTVTISAKK
jgi:4-amino-4-deoxy-L-arabinose transferase-like glycosyltransferase